VVAHTPLSGGLRASGEGMRESREWRVPPDREDAVAPLTARPDTLRARSIPGAGSGVVVCVGRSPHHAPAARAEVARSATRPGLHQDDGGSLSGQARRLGEFLGGGVVPLKGLQGQWLDTEGQVATSFAVLTLEGSADLTITVRNPRGWVVGSVLQGRIDIREDGTSHPVSTGDVYLVCGGAPVRMRYRLTRVRLKLVAIPYQVMRQLGGPPVGVRSGQSSTSSVWDARAWRRLVSEAERMMADPLMAGSPLVGDSLARLLAGTAITLLTGPPTAPPQAGEHRHWPATVERAVDFIESGADLQLDVGDIARAADVTPRALQLSFRRHLGTSPMAYLRRIRLELARSDLKDAVPGDGTTVTSVAAKWGFSQLGRFAASYRAAFHESPKDTLRS